MKLATISVIFVQLKQSWFWWGRGVPFSSSPIWLNNWTSTFFFPMVLQGYLTILWKKIFFKRKGWSNFYSFSNMCKYLLTSPCLIVHYIHWYPVYIITTGTQWNNYCWFPVKFKITGFQWNLNDWFPVKFKRTSFQWNLKMTGFQWNLK